MMSLWQCLSQILQVHRGSSRSHCLLMIRARHPEIEDEFLHELDGGTEAPCLVEAAQAAIWSA